MAPSSACGSGLSLSGLDVPSGLYADKLHVPPLTLRHRAHLHFCERISIRSDGVLKVGWHDFIF